MFKGEDGGLFNSLFTRLPLLEEDELGERCLSEFEAAAAAEAAAKLRKAELCRNVLAAGVLLPKVGLRILSMENGKLR